MKRFGNREVNGPSEILKNDGVICVPTDTVYGVCARISSKEAHDKLVKVKNRPEEKPFPVMCSSKEQIESIAYIDKTAEVLIDSFMPGPITLVLKVKPNVPSYVNNGKDTIAVRMATSSTIKNIIEKVGSPLFMSSANRSGEPTCKTLDEVEKACPNLDGMVEGSVSFGVGSTIVDCSEDTIKILREGPISLSQINKVFEEAKDKREYEKKDAKKFLKFSVGLLIFLILNGVLLIACEPDASEMIYFYVWYFIIFFAVVLEMGKYYKIYKNNEETNYIIDKSSDLLKKIIKKFLVIAFLICWPLLLFVVDYLLINHMVWLVLSNIVFGIIEIYMAATYL